VSAASRTSTAATDGVPVGRPWIRSCWTTLSRPDGGLSRGRCPDSTERRGAGEAGREKFRQTGMSLMGRQPTALPPQKRSQWTAMGIWPTLTQQENEEGWRFRNQIRGELVGTTGRTAERENFVLQQMNRERILDSGKPSERWMDYMRRAMSLE